jgi:aspartyl-tRNA(Asn)/glutamyl-tRNA(Gln) amidotransferase subunit B
VRARVELIEDGTISGRIAKDVFAEMFATGADPASIVERQGLKQISDAGAIEAIAAEIIAANPDQVEKLKSNPKVFGWFVGQVMKATQGQANPQLVNQVLKQKLGS